MSRSFRFTRDALETTLAYVGEREVFGRPLAGMQLTQARLAEMVLSLQQAQLLALAAQLNPPTTPHAHLVA